MGSSGQRGEWRRIAAKEPRTHEKQRTCLPISIFDNKLDRESINPRKQAFEKMVSGMCTSSRLRQ